VTADDISGRNSRTGTKSTMQMSNTAIPSIAARRKCCKKKGRIGMEAAKSAANEEMQENKHTDYIYMVTGDRLVISMNAELDHHLADEMRDVIDTIIEERGVRHLIFDFSKISFMDSSGIGLIMGRYKKLQENGSISIAGANDSIQRIILISGLHKLVHTCKDVSQAAKNIEK
jgi:stage II sporulation protein AA (anti-sigma F factor antagonist)